MTYLLWCLTHCRSLNSLRQCDRQLQESDQLLNLFQTYYRQLLSCSLSQVEIWHLLLLWWLLYLRFLLHNSLKRRTRKPRHSRQQWEIHKTSVLSYKKVKILNREHMNKWGTSTYRYFVLGSSAEINTEKNKVNHFYTSRGQHLVLNRFKASKPTSCLMSQVTAEIQSWMCMQDFFVPSAWKESEPAIRSNQPKHDLTWWQRQAVSRPEILANHTHVGNYFICTFSYT